MFGTRLERTRAAKETEKGANVHLVASVRLHGRNGTSEEECGRGSAVWVSKGDPGCGTVISGRRAGGGSCVRATGAVTLRPSLTHVFRTCRAPLPQTL